LASEPKKYSVFLKPSAEKALSKLSKKNQRLIGERISALANDPRPAGNEQLAPDTYRIRSGDFRIIYRVEDAILKVLVVTIGDRKEVYRRR
jgi:mRNA interferase RelE/StbE